MLGHTTPHLVTALSGELAELENLCLTQQQNIENWFEAQWLEHNSPFYGSVDIRNSGFKIAPVDMNLYPGGFNNINEQFTPLAVNATIAFIKSKYPTAKNMLLIPENHTRNKFYLKNVANLKNILELSGLNVTIGSVDINITEATIIEVENGGSLIYNPLKNINGVISTLSGIAPELILLNNDLSAGVPAILQNITKQILLPPLNAGWYMRKKTNFFRAYNQVCANFAQTFGFDEWKINPHFDEAINIDFANKIGIADLATKVDKMLLKIKHKYVEYGINEDPYLIVKADNGTYGMGIMVVKSANDILEINRKERNKMAVIKDGVSVSNVIIQEGVYTIEEVDGATAEPVVYMMASRVIGGFYRIHKTKKADENLNAVGAEFVPLKFEKQNSTELNRFYTYSVVARLSLLAASLELEQYV